MIRATLQNFSRGTMVAKFKFRYATPVRFLDHGQSEMPSASEHSTA
jgi:hypothetical protein